jgi:hypothetical protein
MGWRCVRDTEGDDVRPRSGGFRLAYFWILFRLALRGQSSDDLRPFFLVSLTMISSCKYAIILSSSSSETLFRSRCAT